MMGSRKLREHVPLQQQAATNRSILGLETCSWGVGRAAPAVADLTLAVFVADLAHGVKGHHAQQSTLHGQCTPIKVMRASLRLLPKLSVLHIRQQRSHCPAAKDMTHDFNGTIPILQPSLFFFRRLLGV